MGTTRTCLTESALMLTLLVACSVATAPLLAGPLTPPGTPGPTMRTLTQVEPRTPLLGDPPYNITQPGSYYLVQDVTGVAGHSGIEISADDVTVDLNGMTIRGIPGSLSGVKASNTVTNVTIRNGTIRDWGGSGINAGGARWQVVDVRAHANGWVGISLGDGAVVRECEVTSNTGTGIYARDGTLVENCVASQNNSKGIEAGSRSIVRGCVSRENTGQGLTVARDSIVAQCLSFESLSDGLRLADRCTVVDCVVTSSTGDGITGSYAPEGVIITRCTASWNRGPNGGIFAGKGSVVRDCTTANNSMAGIAAISCVVAGNNCTDNEDGIHCGGTGSRIEGNRVSGNRRGIQVLGSGNVIVGNVANGNTVDNYDIAADNFPGTEVTTATVMNSSANSLVNISIP